MLRHHGIRMNMKPFGGSGARFHGFDFPVARRGVGHKGMEQVLGGVSDLVHGAIEGFFVRFGRLGEAAQFPNELKRRRADLVLGRGRRKVMQGSDVSTHEGFLGCLG
jgi:hypothetical protein